MLTMAFMCLSAPDVRLHGICHLSHSLQTTRVLSKQMHKVPVFWGFVVSKQISLVQTISFQPNTPNL